MFSNERIRTAVATAETLNDQLYLDAQSMGGAARDFYLQPTWITYDLVEGSFKSLDDFSATPRNISFANYMLEYIAKQRTFWWYTGSATVPSDPVVWWLNTNGPGTLSDAMNASMFQAFSESTSTSDAVKLSNYLVLLVALTVFTLVACVAIIPAIVAVMREQHEVFDVLAEVPLRVIRQLRDAAAEKVAAMKRADEGEDQAIEVAGAFGEDMDAEAAAAALEAAEASVRGQLLEPRVDEPQRGSSCCVKGRVAPQPKRRTYRRAASGLSLLMLRLLWPVLLFCLYFVLTFFWRDTVNNTVKYFRSEVLWGAELQLLVPMVSYSLRNALLYNSSAVWVPFWINKTASQMQLASTLLDSLTYGSDAQQLRPALTASPTAYTLLMQNGCVQNTVTPAECLNYGGKPCNYFYSYAYCYEPPSNTDPTYPVFFYGLVGKGLLPALKQFLLLASGLLSDRAAALKSGAALSPLDLTQPPLSYVDQLGRLYLPAGLEAMSQGRLAEDTVYLNSFSSLNLTATVLSVFAMMFIFLAHYRPVLTTLDADIKNARSLLLLLPEDAARSVPAVLDAGKRLMVNQ